MGVVSGSQNSQQKKFITQQQRGNSPTQFPMGSDDVLKHYGKHLSQYERDEIADYDVIYYLNLNSKNKGVGQYILNEMTC